MNGRPSLPEHAVADAPPVLVAAPVAAPPPRLRAQVLGGVLWKFLSQGFRQGSRLIVALDPRRACSRPSNSAWRPRSWSSPRS